MLRVGMRREIRLRCGLRQGRFYKILQRVGAIPAGVYRFEGRHGGGLEFSVGARREVRFVLRRLDRTLIVQVPYRSGFAQRSSEYEFLERLYKNIELGIEQRIAELAQ
jgi:hypothetical protein